MHAVRQLLSIVISLLLIVGAVCSCVCEVNCAFLGCPTAASAKSAEVSTDNPERDTQASHCHQPESRAVEHHQPESQSETHHQPAPEPMPQHGDHSPDCQDHTSASATMPNKVGTAAAQQIQVPVAEMIFHSGVSFAQPTGQLAHNYAFKSPPARAVVSVLRI